MILWTARIALAVCVSSETSSDDERPLSSRQRSLGVGQTGPSAISGPGQVRKFD
jgi:hypothetical protein